MRTFFMVILAILAIAGGGYWAHQDIDKKVRLVRAYTQNVEREHAKFAAKTLVRISEIENEARVLRGIASSHKDKLHAHAEKLSNLSDKVKTSTRLVLEVNGNVMDLKKNSADLIGFVERFKVAEAQGVELLNIDKTADLMNDEIVALTPEGEPPTSILEVEKKWFDLDKDFSAYLGIEFRKVEANDEKRLGVKRGSQKGIFVDGVIRESPAYEANIRAGNIITRLDGKMIDYETFAASVRRLKSGYKTYVSYINPRGTQTNNIRFAGHFKRRGVLIAGPFGSQNKLIVTHVESEGNSQTPKAVLATDDVIFTVNGKKIKSLYELQKEINASVKKNGFVNLFVYRENRYVTVMWRG